MLSSDERSFLSRMDLTEADVFDGRSLSRKVAQERARNLRKPAMLSTLCNNGGHRLRWVSGHCAICNPSYRAFSRRYSERAFVYVAYSAKKGVCKIGLARSVSARERTLNGQSYAGANDWVEVVSVETDDAGSVENSVHSLLRDHAILNLYWEKDGKQQACKEVFNCTTTQARRALAAAIERSATGAPSRTSTRRRPDPTAVTVERNEKDRAPRPSTQREVPVVKKIPHVKTQRTKPAHVSTDLPQPLHMIVECRHCAQRARMDLRRRGPKCPRCGASLWDAHLLDADPKE